MKKLRLTGKLGKGKYVLVDDNLFEGLAQYKWYLSSRGRRDKEYHYATRSTWDKKTKKRGQLLLHRCVINAPTGQFVDHINGNTLDNRKENLRVCSHKENIRNGDIRFGNRSGYKGIVDTPFGWRAHITKNGKRFASRRFSDPILAALAYDMLAYQLHGEFANTNFGVRGNKFNFLI